MNGKFDNEFSIYSIGAAPRKSRSAAPYNYQSIDFGQFALVEIGR
jgi:hypothetical protein